jgi:hypothetical protein
VLGDDRLKMFSASGGNSLVLDRTGESRFYGSGTINGGWARSYRMHIIRADHKGTATKVKAFNLDRITGSYTVV